MDGPSSAERVGSSAQSGNARLFDLSLRRSVMVERYKAGETIKMVRLLDPYLEDIDDLVASTARRIHTRGPAALQLKGYRATERRLGEITSAAGTAFHSALAADMLSFAKLESQWMAGALTDVMPPGVNWTASRALTPELRAAIGKPINGKHLRELTKSVSASMRARVVSQIRQGMLNGDSVREMTKRIAPELRTTQKHAQAIVHTATAQVHSEARVATVEANPELKLMLRWVSTLDNRTTEICLEYDGKVFAAGEMDPPPAHILCRSTVVPELPRLSELGIPGIKDIPEGTRASWDGPVRASFHGKEWVKTQPVKVQQELIGKRKAELLREGFFDNRSLVDQAGRPLSLEQLGVR